MGALFKILTGFITGPFVNAALDMFKEFQLRKMTEAEMRAEMEQRFMAMMTEVYTKEIEAKANVLIAEINGESWLQRNWRPMVAMTAFTSYWFVIIVYPFFVSWGWMPPVKFGEEGLQNLFYLVTVSVGGYMTLRSFDKYVQTRATKG